MKNHDRKITSEQRAELIRLHVEVGSKAARTQAREWGVAANYPAMLASTSGVHRKGWKPEDWNDPRWQWAKERGPILWP